MHTTPCPPVPVYSTKSLHRATTSLTHTLTFNHEFCDTKGEAGLLWDGCGSSGETGCLQTGMSVVRFQGLPIHVLMYPRLKYSIQPSFSGCGVASECAWMLLISNWQVTRQNIEKVNVICSAKLLSGQKIRKAQHSCRTRTFSWAPVFTSSHQPWRSCNLYMDTHDRVHSTNLAPSVRKRRKVWRAAIRNVQNCLKQVEDSSQNTVVAFWQHRGRHW